MNAQVVAQAVAPKIKDPTQITEKESLQLVSSNFKMMSSGWIWKNDDSSSVIRPETFFGLLCST